MELEKSILRNSPFPVTFVTMQVSSTHFNLEKYDQGILRKPSYWNNDWWGPRANTCTRSSHLVRCMDALTSLHDSVQCKSVYIKVAWRDITNVQYLTSFVIQLIMPVCVSWTVNQRWLEENKHYSILFYSILFYSILFYSILFYPIQF
jgi:hypothetical protein